MVNLYDSYKQSRLINSIPDTSASMMKYAMHTQEKDEAYQNQIDKSMGGFAEAINVPILSRADRETFNREVESARSQIEGTLKDPSLDARAKYSSINERIRSFSSNPLIANIISGAKMANEQLARGGDPAIQQMYRSFAEDTWDTSKMGVFNRPFNDKYSPILVADKISKMIPDQHYDRSLNPSDPLSSTYVGVSEKTMNDYLSKNIESFYRAEGGNFYYEMAYPDLNEAERMEIFKSDVSNAFTPHLGISPAVRKGGADGAGGAGGGAADRDPMVPKPSIWATQMTGAFKEAAVAIAKNAKGSIDVGGKQMTAEEIESLNDPVLYSSIIKNARASGVGLSVSRVSPQTIIDKADAQEIIGKKFISYKTQNGNFVGPTHSSDIQPVLFSQGRNLVSFVRDSRVNKLLHDLHTNQSALSTVNNALSMRLTVNPDGNIAAIYNVTIGNNNPALYDFMDAYVSAIGVKDNTFGGKVFSRDILKTAIARLYENRSIKVAGATTGRSTFTMHDILVAALGKDSPALSILKEYPNITLTFNNVNVGVNRKGEVIKKDRDGKKSDHGIPDVSFSVNTSFPVSHFIFDPTTSGTPVSNTGSVRSGQTIF